MSCKCGVASFRICWSFVSFRARCLRFRVLFVFSGELAFQIVLEKEIGCNSGKNIDERALALLGYARRLMGWSRNGVEHVTSPANHKNQEFLIAGKSFRKLRVKLA